MPPHDDADDRTASEEVRPAHVCRAVSLCADAGDRKPVSSEMICCSLPGDRIPDSGQLKADKSRAFQKPEQDTSPGGTQESGIRIGLSDGSGWPIFFQGASGKTGFADFASVRLGIAARWQKFPSGCLGPAFHTTKEASLRAGKSPSHSGTSKTFWERARGKPNASPADPYHF